MAVSYQNEWIAEAYLEADYSRITQADFERDLKRYALFNLMLDAHLGLEDVEEDDADE